MRIIAIAAVAKNGVIGWRGKLPWTIPEDLKFFRDSTRGQRVVMGRKTFESLGKPLPGRENVVITRNQVWSAPGVRVVSDFQSALQSQWDGGEAERRILFVIGGGEIYRESIPYLDEIWLTEIDASPEGDAWFPEFRGGKLQIPGFELKSLRPQGAPHPDGLQYHFAVYSRSS